jgi:hypothetical protein
VWVGTFSGRSKEWTLHHSTKISLCITQKKAVPCPYLPYHSYCSAGFDWLGVDLEVRSLCYWPIPQIGIKRIEECVHRNYGRRPIDPPDVIKIVLIYYKVVFLGVASQPPCHALEGALNAISIRVVIDIHIHLYVSMLPSKKRIPGALLKSINLFCNCRHPNFYLTYL